MFSPKFAATPLLGLALDSNLLWHRYRRLPSCDLLLTDRLWFKRLTGEGEHPNKLNAIIYEDRRELALARANEDDRKRAELE